MEIEIGESLCLSYLKHVKKCVIYQTNWKLSSWWLQELGKKSPAEELYDELKKTPSKEKTAATDFDVKDVLTSDFSQFLKQAEIDVLGVDKDGNVYAIDVAFHEGGLDIIRSCFAASTLGEAKMTVHFLPGKQPSIIIYERTNFFITQSVLRLFPYPSPPS